MVVARDNGVEGLRQARELDDHDPGGRVDPDELPVDADTEERARRAQWWLTGDATSPFFGVGIYGQFVWIDPTAGIVIVKLSSLPKALDTVVTRDHHRAFASVAAALA